MTGYNKRKTGWILKIALTPFVLLIASQSYAACSQSDMTGTWYFNGVTGDTFFSEFWETDFCKIKVNSTGNIVASSSSCNYRDDNGKGTLDVEGGSVTVKSGCAVTAQIEYCDGDFCVKFNSDAARLDKGKKVITMVGRLNVEPDIVSFFTGVKK